MINKDMHNSIIQLYYKVQNQENLPGVVKTKNYNKEKIN